MNVEPLVSLIQAQGLAAYQTELLAHVRPAIALHLEPAQPGQVGHSRIGGVPDLPASIAWLQDDRLNKYLCFLLQINLADLPVFAESPFPRQGMLYLFADEDGEPEQVVLYTGSESLTPALLPNEAEFVTDWYVDLIEHQLTFTLFADLPRWATDDYQALCDRLQLNENSYDDLIHAIDTNSIGKLLGHVAGIGHDPREDAYIVREINPNLIYDYQQRSKLDMTGARRWCNLLQVNSSQAVDLLFGDSGYLQLLVHDHDLQRQDFSRVYINLESS
ncbi:DUF1963 domain-containing protein [Oculatella sp. LEGE 06141]|uniref:YwqG family protein n=1 Tax=Oculatella sp. LEGE 06141 TaxID=1828648 RepID=UPI001882BFE1|nr:YwqG family protein [Oculatella sp. LEGE 06141]MBE9181178.1 DUF1963 domain-containing protein [Oculatella sp. LEGE 06141]